MDKQEYLNQISAMNRPVKKKSNGIFASKFFWVISVGVIAFALIMIVGGILDGTRVDNKSRLLALILHMNNTSEAIKEYQPSVKSSELRSYSASLRSLLTDESNQLTNFATENYKIQLKDLGKEDTEEAEANKDALMNDLFDAKINGNLDRIYAHKLTYEISMIIDREVQLIKSTSNESLKEILETSYKSLSNIYDRFNSFSEAN